MKEFKYKKVIDITFFCMLLAAVGALMFRLFYNQTLGSYMYYPSDMEAYILEMQGLESGYEFPYPLFFKLAALINLFTTPEMAIAFTTTLLNCASMIIVKAILSYEVENKLRERLGKFGCMSGVMLSVLSVTLFFVSMLFPPEGIYLPGIKHDYMGVFSPNPHHNATYMAARPFAILAFVWCVKLLDVYEDGFKKEMTKDYVLFSLFLLLATMTKPSFTLVLVATVGIIVVWRMFKSRCANIIPSIQFGICFIPTFVDLLYQYSGVFVPDEGVEGGVGFTFGQVWAQYCDNIPLAIVLAIGFPLSVLVMNYKSLKEDTFFRLSFQLYLVSLLTALFLCEKGFRWTHFNFSWGYMCGIFFAFLGSLCLLLRKTARGDKWWRLVLQWLPYLWHVACGVYYFVGISQGKTYY